MEVEAGEKVFLNTIVGHLSFTWRMYIFENAKPVHSTIQNGISTWKMIHLSLLEGSSIFLHLGLEHFLQKKLMKYITIVF